jgi:iron complex outermembrane recepter protein
MFIKMCKAVRNISLTNSTNRRLQYVYAGILASLSLQTAAVAEERQLEEILVTAQKRTESLQDIPISVTAISAKDLEIMGIRDSVDLTRASASLTYTEGGSKQESSFRIRGIGTSVYSISVEPSVAVVIDNVSQIQSAQAFTNLIDVERVEVLRGPQSTLFGKNASAGLINVVTKRSSNITEGFVEATATDDDELRFKGSLSGPLGDKLGYRLTGFYTDYDGYGENLHQNNEDINGTQSEGFRGHLEWAPTDDLDFRLIAFYTKDEDDCCTPTHRSVSPDAIWAGFIPFDTMNPLTNPSKSNQDPETDDPPDAETKDKGFSLHADWQVGGHTLTSITAYNEYSYEYAEDQDWSGYDLYGFMNRVGLYPNNESGGIVGYSDMDTDLVSQELRLLSPSGGDWEYLVGLYYADADTDRDYQRTFPLSFSVWSGSTSNTTKAVFGQVTWRMTERTHLTLGGRYNDEEFSVDYRGEEITGAISSDYSDSDSDDEVLGKLSVQHFLNEESMLFVGITQGYKGGAFEVQGGEGAQASDPIDPETSVSYEIGAKTTLLDRRLQFNATAFYTEFEDYQAQSVEFTDNELRTTLNNVGELETKGVEVDAVALLGQRLTLTLGAAWIDATVEDYPGANCYTGQTEAQGCIDGVQDLSGKDLNNSPDWKFNLGAEYDLPLPSLPFDGFITAAYTWQDELNFSLSNNPITVHDSYGLANFSLGITERENNRYRVSLFVNNAFDQDYASGIADVSAIYNGARTLMHQVPRGAERYAGIRLRLGF